MQNNCCWNLEYSWFFLDFCYIAKYFNSDRILEYRILLQNTSKIRNVKCIFQNCKKKFQKCKKKWKNSHGFSKINQFDWNEKRVGYPITYWTFFYQFFIIFRELLLCKIKVFEILNEVDYFSDFCYIAKYWNSDRILKYDIESCYKNTFKIRNVKFIFQNFENENIEKIHMDSQKSINSMEMKN